MNPPLFVLLLVLAGSGAGSALAAQTNVPPPKTDAPPSYKSVFIDDFKSGKDPFFPKSTRRGVVADPKSAATNTVAALPAGLVLKGLAGPPRRRLAIINSHTLAAGETADIKVDGQVVKVQCLEVRERSVLLRCNDQTPRELFIRRGI